MTNFATANPEQAINKAALEVTQLHLQQATQLAGTNKDLIPALIVALALNKQTLHMPGKN